MTDQYDPAVDAAARGLLSASCLAPSQLAALRARGTHGLPIDLVEPCPARVEGDRVPCHLFMPVVPWHEPLPPVIRMRPRREHWLLTPPPARPSLSADLSEPPGFGAMAALSLGTWCLGAALLVVAHLKGWF